MRSKQRTAAEKKWHSDVAHFATNSDWMSRYHGFCIGPNVFQLDHILGAQAKKKVNLVSEKVGEWLIIPVPVDLHDITSNNPLNVTVNKKGFEKEFGNRINLWMDMVYKMKAEGYHIPFSDDVIKAVM